MDNCEYIVVFVTTDSETEAKQITNVLLENRLAACASIIPRVSSSYWWKGQIESADEYLMIIKTRKSIISDVVKIVKEKHSAIVPEIVAVPIIGGNAEYLSWMDEVISDNAGRG